MHGDLVVAVCRRMQQLRFEWVRFLLSKTTTQTSCRQPASLKTQKSITNSPLHSIQGPEKMHRPVQRLCGTALMQVEDVNLGWGYGGGFGDGGFAFTLPT